jgi:2-polyprenyl-6-methoxyphenol hydroxylase-like FAD-dependent oxidoreductase
MSDRSFRVIIVGAGPIGLYLAHAMEKANIDYVLLEQQSTVLNPSGQLLFTWPQTVRLLDQLGLYKAARDAAMPIHYKKRVWGPNGQVTSTNRFWDHVEPK